MALYPSRGRRVFMPCLFLLALTLVLAACGGNSTTPTTNKKAVLTIFDSPKGDFTSNFNPLIDPQTSRYGSEGFLYETLLYYNRLTGEIKPWLASNYQVSSDQSSITFTIRDGVKWSDNQPFTADDVVFTLNLLKQYPAVDRNGLWKTLIKSVSESSDKKTVTIQLLAPSSTSAWYIGGQTFIVPQHIWSTVGDPSKYTNDSPVVTGPFTLKSFSSQLFVYQKNPNYWQPGLPKVDQIRMPAVSSNTNALLQLAQGSIDWAGIGYDPTFDAKYVNKNPSVNHTWFPASNVVTLYANLTNPILGQLPVRQAISYAIDRSELQKKAAPYAPPATPTGLLPANQDYVASDYSNLTFSVDVAKAKSLLEGAGFKLGSDGIYADASGKKLSFKLDVVNGWSDWQADASLIKTDLKNIGIDVQINTLSDFAPYFSNLQNGSYDLSISWTSPGPTPYYLYYALLGSANTAPIGQAASTNWERWNDKATDQLLQQYATSGDPNVQKQAIQGLEKIMVDKLPAIPLTYNPYWDEFRTANFTGWPDKDHPYAVPSPTNYPDDEYIVLQLRPVA